MRRVVSRLRLRLFYKIGKLVTLDHALPFSYHRFLCHAFSVTIGYSLPGFVLLLIVQNLPVERFGTAGAF